MKLYLDFNDYVNVADACGFGTCVAMDSFVHGMTEAGLTVSLSKNEDLYPGVVRVFGNKDMAKEVFRTLVQSFTAGFETGYELSTGL